MVNSELSMESANRRTFLKALGATVAGSSLAGFQEQGPTHEFVATPTGLSEAGRKKFRFPSVDHEEVVDEWTVAVGGDEVDVTTTSHALAYPVPNRQARTEWPTDGPDGASIAVLSTPEASVAGREVNPLAKRPLSDLVTGDTGRNLLRWTGIGEGSQLSLPRAPKRITTRKNIEFLGQSTTLETYAGIERMRNRHGAFLLHVARVRKQGSAVILGVVQRRQLKPKRDLDDIKLVGGGILGEPELIDLSEVPIDISPYITFVPDIDIPVPSLGLTDVRLVQTVEDTHVEGGSYEEPDPDIVVQKNTSVAFDINGIVVDRLPSDVHVAISGGKEGEPPGFYRTIHLHGEDVEAIVEGDYDPLAVLHEYASDGYDHPGDGPPVLKPSKALEWVEVRIGLRDEVAGDAVTLRRGRDYELTETSTFRVAFVPVHDMKGGENYGDSDGETQDYEGAVSDAVDYLERVYPTPGITAYRHDVPLQGFDDSFEFFFGNVGVFDFKRAKSRMDEEVKSPEFPANGEFVSEGEISPAHKVEEEGFDAVIVVAPGDVSGTPGTDYFTYHWGNNYGGNAPGPSDAAVGAMEPETGWPSPEKYVGTVAQEISHRLRDDPYEDPSGHPTAQRDDGGKDTEVSGVPVDHDHAREEDSDYDGDGTKDKPGVRSTAFDFTDGTFAVVHDYDYDGSGRVTMRGPRSERSTVSELHSFMSYSGPPRWTDARIHQDLIDGGFEPGGGAGAAGTPASVVSAYGTVTGQGTVEFGDVRAYKGFAYGTDQQQGPVTVTFENPSGDAVKRTALDDTVKMTHGDTVEGIVTFTLEFPFESAFISVEGMGTVTRLNPIERSVRDAVGRVPDDGFRMDPEQTREKVSAALDEVDELMRDGQFSDAAEIMRDTVRPLLEEALAKQYAATFDQPERRELLALVERMVQRLGTLANES